MLKVGKSTVVVVETDSGLVGAGKLYTPDAAGLGVHPDFPALGEPVAVYQ